MHDRTAGRAAAAGRPGCGDLRQQQQAARSQRDPGRHGVRRTLRCTTPAGALDAYAKSVLENSGYYRAMCAPLSQQEEIANSLRSAAQDGRWPLWETGLPCWPNTQFGYFIYNLEPVGGDAYEGLLVVQLNGPPDGQPAEGSGTWLGVQRVRAERQEDRWVALPLEEFEAVPTTDAALQYGCRDLPAYLYEAQTENFTLQATIPIGLYRGQLYPKRQFVLFHVVF